MSRKHLYNFHLLISVALTGKFKPSSKSAGRRLGWPLASLILIFRLYILRGGSHTMVSKLSSFTQSVPLTGHALPRQHSPKIHLPGGQNRPYVFSTVFLYNYLPFLFIYPNLCRFLFFAHSDGAGMITVLFNFTSQLMWMVSVSSPGSGQAHIPIQTLGSLKWGEDYEGAGYIYGQ